MEGIGDPDYEITQAAKERIRIREETEKKQCAERVKSVIKREFQNELEFREKQLELIQSRITKATKTLHLLRYCLVMSYYNRSELQFNPSENDVASFDQQSRIHPAVKKLLGNNPSEIHTALGLRKKRTIQKTLGNTVVQESSESTLKKEITEEIEVTPVDTIVENIPSENVVENVHSVRNRKLYKHQIVIGNISKWAPSESADDNSTHKWMVYVRGPKEFPDISHIIQKAVFFLHPSYKPNDVIEISESPFHLSRRGWGEFPLRIQLYFHGKMNKPVDIIHHLKLDKTYTGRQTLGNETVIELSLYDLAKSNIPSNSLKTNVVESSIKVEVKQEELDVDQIESTHNETWQEPMDIKVEIEPTIVTYVNLDHSYCLTELAEVKNNKKSEMQIDDIEHSSNLRIQETETDDKVQTNKKRKIQKSLLKSSILKKIKKDSIEEQSKV